MNCGRYLFGGLDKSVRSQRLMYIDDEVSRQNFSEPKFSKEENTQLSEADIFLYR